MTQAAHEWVRRLSGEPLPVLRRTLTRVRDLLNSSSVNHARLSDIISRDPGFSLYVLQRLKGLPNAPRAPVSKISLAIPLLGMEQINQASRTLTCLEDRLKGPPRRGLIDCYSRGAHAAIYASGLAKLRGDHDAGALYTAALLHDLAEMALWAQQPDLMLQFRQRIRQGDGRDDAALEVLGCTLEEISYDLSEKWQLPELIRTAQGMDNSHQPRPLMVMFSAALARESSLGWMRQETLDDAELLAEFLDAPIESVLSWLHTLSAEAARQLSALPIPLPAFHLISSADYPVRETTRQIAPLQSPPVETPAPPSPQAEAAPETKPDIQPQEPPQEEKTNPLQQVFTRALAQMRQEHGLQRAMFAILSADKTLLKARIVVEASSDHTLKNFSVDLTTPTIFSLLLEKQQAIALTPGNRDKYQTMIPAGLSATINEKSFLAMSVFLRNKPVGLFYADSGPNAISTSLQYSNFKATCQRTILSLG